MELLPGQDCVIYGLQAIPHYNGQTGIVDKEREDGRLATQRTKSDSRQNWTHRAHAQTTKKTLETTMTPPAPLPTTLPRALHAHLGTCCAGEPNFWHTQRDVCQKVGPPAQQLPLPALYRPFSRTLRRVPARM